MGTRSDWEIVRQKPLGAGGQSTVFLVRRPERRARRQESLEILKRWSGQGLNDEKSAVPYSAATVDLAREEEPSELAALKLFNPRAAGPEAEQQALGRMQNEIAVLKQNRRGLLKLLDYNESEKWIVTEYYPRGTLAGHLLKYKGNAKLALSSFLSLVQTVAELHKEPIVHRDIKPQNIFVGDRDELVLGDFGIVFLPNQPERLSVTGESVGPHDFMPPWVFLNEQPGPINPNFDVYMLGKVLWCMVAGKLKLHREDFRDPRLDVTKLFQNDPDMHLVNQILGKCVVTREEDCLGSAQDLLLMVEAMAQMIRRGGQLLRDDVPRPCRVCGQGLYHVQTLPPGTSGEPVAALSMAGISIRVQLFFCDSCGHAQLFKAGETLMR